MCRIGFVGMGFYIFGMIFYYLFYSILSGGILIVILKYIVENCYLVGLKEKVVFVMSRIFFFWSVIIFILFLILNLFFCDIVFFILYFKYMVYFFIVCIVVVI